MLNSRRRQRTTRSPAAAPARPHDIALAGRRPDPPGIAVAIPGRGTLRLLHLVLDFNGTLARDGRLLPGVRSRLARLGKQLEVTVLTADTFGTVRAELRSTSVGVRTVRSGAEKRRFVARLAGVAAIGNGQNDVGMLRHSALGLAVLGPEGCAGALLQEADVVTGDIRTALDLLVHPRRLTATLRR
jgi:soluble P-type ATPase